MDPIFIEIITSPNCPHSPRALKVASKLVSKFKFPVILQECSIETEEGQARAYEFSVDSTPAVVINGRVAFLGVPSQGELKDAVMKVKEKEEERNTYFF